MYVCHEKVNKSSLPFRAERRRREARRQACTRPEVYKSRRSLLGPAGRRPAQGLVMIMMTRVTTINIRLKGTNAEKKRKKVGPLEGASDQIPRFYVCLPSFFACQNHPEVLKHVLQ